MPQRKLTAQVNGVRALLCSPISPPLKSLQSQSIAKFAKEMGRKGIAAFLSSVSSALFHTLYTFHINTAACRSAHRFTFSNPWLFAAGHSLRLL
jgi:hypothetical protein